MLHAQMDPHKTRDAGHGPPEILPDFGWVSARVNTNSCTERLLQLSRSHPLLHISLELVFGMVTNANPYNGKWEMVLLPLHAIIMFLAGSMRRHVERGLSGRVDPRRSPLGAWRV